jgi:hypothetical protein
MLANEPEHPAFVTSVVADLDSCDSATFVVSNAPALLSRSLLFWDGDGQLE